MVLFLFSRSRYGPKNPERAGDPTDRLDSGRNGITRVPRKLDPALAQECHDGEFWDAFPGSLDPELTTSPGRPKSIPPWAWPEVLRLHGQGLGYRRVAAALLSLKVWTTKSSVERLIKGKPPYSGRGALR